MTPYSDPDGLLCRNCGQPIRDGSSNTGLVHTATGYVRCDGLRRGSAGERHAPRAVAA